MDSSKAMCSVVERMKSVSKFVCIDAAMTGTLILRTENDTVSIKTFFRNLTPEFSAYSAARCSWLSATAAADSPVLCALQRLTRSTNAETQHEQSCELTSGTSPNFCQATRPASHPASSE